MTYIGPVLLTSEHSILSFDCEKPALNQWLANRAVANQATGTSRTWVVTYEEPEGEQPARVAGYYASATGSILRSKVPAKLARNQPEEVPVVLLGRMAVDAKHKGRGLGAAMLQHFMLKALEIGASVGVRLVLVHAKDEEAKSFYRHYDFVESPIDELTLMMLLPGNRR